MSEYGMPREELRAELEEIMLAARPNINIREIHLRMHLEALEELAFGVRDRQDDVDDPLARWGRDKPPSTTGL